ncbi:hypothetical protein BH23PLA1_BH23PLA1_05290 [soil metagenome]
MPDERNKPPATNLSKEATHDQISTDTTEMQASPEFEDIVPPPPDRPEGQDQHAAQELSSKPDPGSEDAPMAVNPRVAEQKFGTGVEGEVNVWEARYSLKNFIGRFTVMTVLSVSWLVLALFVFAEGSYGRNAEIGTLVLGGILLLLWLWLGWRVFQTRYGRYYRLTNRRLFVSNGLFYRERDQVELLTVNDVHTVMSTILHRWFDFGDVIVSSREDKTATSYIIGINHPKDVQDLVWHYARSERERRAVQIDQV